MSNINKLIKHLLPEKQLSDAFGNSLVLALSGGFQDAYTYNCRDKVFSNAQTGNVVLMSQNFMEGNWLAGMRYLFPLFAFAFAIGAGLGGIMTGVYGNHVIWVSCILLLISCIFMSLYKIK